MQQASLLLPQALDASWRVAVHAFLVEERTTRAGLFGLDLVVVRGSLPPSSGSTASAGATVP